MPTMMLKNAIGLCLLLCATMAQAATITHKKLDATTEMIRIEGNIVSGDLERFRQISLRYPKAVVTLNSDGGLIYPAIEIGKIIKVMGYSTIVEYKNVCLSACALIWIAGSERSLDTEGRLGFHASYRNDNGKLVESGVANALVGSYLTSLGASAKTIVFTTAAPPEDVLWLTGDNRAASGIDFTFVISPLPPPARTVPVSAASPPVTQPRLPMPRPPDSRSSSRSPSPLRYTPKPPALAVNPFTRWDYPDRASQEGRTGITGFLVTVSPKGRARNCQIISSSGHADLDQTTCAKILKARFFPAIDGRGRPTAGTYSSRVNWSISSKQEPVAAPLPDPAVADDAFPPLPDGAVVIEMPPNWQWEENIPELPWVWIGDTMSGGKIYINQESFKQHSKSIWEFWTKYDATYDASVKYRKSMSLIQINYNNKSMKSISYTDYDKFGNVTDSWNEGKYSANSFEPIVPETIGDGLYRAVCH